MLNRFDLALYYTQAKLESESSRNYIGYLWWIIDPLLSVAIYYFIFKVLLKRGEENYIEFLFIGLICWKWFSLSLKKSASSILRQRSLYKKIYVPKYIFPLIEVLYQSWKFLVIFIFIIILYPLLGFPVSINHLYLPIIMMVQLILTIGLSLCMANIVPFFPDLNFLINHIMKLWMYPSGIIFAISSIPPQYQQYVKLNLIASIIESYRNIILFEKPPIWSQLLISTLIGILLVIIGLVLLNKNDKKFAKLL